MAPAGSHQTPLATAHLSEPNGHCGTSARGAGLVPNTRATDEWFIKCHACFRGALHAPGLPGQGAGKHPRKGCPSPYSHVDTKCQTINSLPWGRSTSCSNKGQVCGLGALYRSREMSEMFPTPEAMPILSPAHLELAEPPSHASQDILSQKACNIFLE